mmetsp:Transcript_20630/g.52092  ORF Transcript_20630/g.52092 Transcript_20630/m.52092 type:complete len:112 (-) Transcript_20630:2-337(-)
MAQRQEAFLAPAGLGLGWHCLQRAADRDAAPLCESCSAWHGGRLEVRQHCRIAVPHVTDQPHKNLHVGQLASEGLSLAIGLRRVAWQEGSDSWLGRKGLRAGPGCPSRSNN